MPPNDEKDVHTVDTLGEEIIAWIESHCRVPEGALIGEPIRLLDWQRDFILKVYDNPRAVTRRAILSVGRKSGKTTFAACLLLAHVAGPAAAPNSQTYSAAQSRDQAALLYGGQDRPLVAVPERQDRLQGRGKAIGLPGTGHVISRAQR